MPARSAIPIVRAIFIICCLMFGIFFGMAGMRGLGPTTGGVLGLVFGGLIVGADVLLKNMTIRSFGSGTFGLMTGVFCAWLLTRVPWAQLLFPPQSDSGEGFDRILNLVIYLTDRKSVV